MNTYACAACRLQICTYICKVFNILLLLHTVHDYMLCFISLQTARAVGSVSIKTTPSGHKVVGEVHSFKYA